MPFSATVFAAGSGTIACNRPDEPAIAQGDRLTRVEVFVRIEPGNLTCTRDLRLYPILVSLVFRSAGVSTIRVIGLSSSVATAPLDSLERRVVVVP